MPNQKSGGGGGQPSEGRQAIGVRASFTQKPPTDSKHQIVNSNLYQKNFKYLETNRTATQSFSLEEGSHSRQSTSNTLLSARRDH